MKLFSRRIHALKFISHQRILWNAILLVPACLFCVFLQRDSITMHGTFRLCVNVLCQEVTRCTFLMSGKTSNLLNWCLVGAPLLRIVLPNVYTNSPLRKLDRLSPSTLFTSWFIQIYFCYDCFFYILFFSFFN